ncbi:MAG TPA: lysylphosphatidylglycerol synthase transmembrane domain-containing protein [Candidatus Acidoferrales bacterium]|nr:lysylphosphatidylglycerol synthase transmembrane domain-containing protein [Candidatus Acidoferrales bacterium]
MPEGGEPALSRGPMFAVLRRVWVRLRAHWITLAGLVAVVGLIIAVNPGKVAHDLTGADTGLLAWMLPVVLLLYVMRGVSWSIVLRGASQDVGLEQAIRVTFISQAFVFLPGGDLWRVPIVKTGSGLPTNAGIMTATVVFDDLIYLFVLTFAMVPVVVRSPVLAIPLAVALVPQLAIFAILLSPRVYHWLASRVGRMRLFHRFQIELDALGPTFRALVRSRVLLPVVAVDVIAVVLSIALFALGLAAVHGTGTDVPHIAYTYAASQVVTNLTVLPGALGAYEGMMTGAMALQGVSPAAAAGGALLYRVANDVLMALLGLAIAFAFDREYLRAFRSAPEKVVS